MKKHTGDENPEGTEGARFGGKQGFKKKHNNKQKSQQPNTAGEFFTGFGFSIGPHGPEMYQKTLHKVGLYASMQFKNGSDVTICLLEEKLVKPEVPVLEEEHTVHDKHVWEYRMNELMKTEKLLEGNLRSQFMVLMSLCDSTTKNKIENTSEYPKLMKRLDSMGLLSVIKKLVYTIFMYKTDRQKYGNILDQMENDVLQKKDPFPKTVSEASTLMAGWKGKSNNQYINKYNEANNGIAFATDGKEEKTGNKNKKKEIKCFKCGEKGHYSNECDKEQSDDGKTMKASNKMGSNFLMSNDNQHGYSSDEEDTETPYTEYEFMAIQEANEKIEESEDDDADSGSSNNHSDFSDKSSTEEDDDDGYEGFAFLHSDVVCSNQDKAGIPNTWILLDSQSTIE